MGFARSSSSSDQATTTTTTVDDDSFQTGDLIAQDSAITAARTITNYENLDLELADKAFQSITGTVEKAFDAISATADKTKDALVSQGQQALQFAQGSGVSSVDLKPYIVGAVILVAMVFFLKGK